MIAQPATAAWDSPDDSVLQQPIASVELEEKLLGCLLLEGDTNLDLLLGLVRSQISEEAFHHGPHRTLFRTICRLHDGGHPAGLSYVAATLADTDNDYWTPSRLAALVDSVLGSASVDAYAELLRTKWQRRRLLQVGETIRCLAHTENRPLEDCLDEALAAVQQVYAGALSSRNAYRDGDALLPELGQAFLEPQRMARPFTTFSRQLDQYLQGGWRNPSDQLGGRLVVLTGATSCGKTALACRIALHQVLEHGQPVVINTLEMSNREYLTRFITHLTRIEARRLLHQQYRPGEPEAVRGAIAQLLDQPGRLRLCDLTHFSYPELIRTIRSEVQSTAASLVVVDHLHLIDIGSREDDRSRINGIVTLLKNLALELHVDILLLAQMSRAVATRQNKRPILADLRESSAIEQAANVVLGLYRDEYYDPNSVDRGVTEVHVLKNREGQVGHFRLLHELPFSHYRDPPDLFQPLAHPPETTP